MVKAQNYGFCKRKTSSQYLELSVPLFNYSQAVRKNKCRFDSCLRLNARVAQ